MANPTSTLQPTWSKLESAPCAQGWTHYGPSAGLPELRQAIAEDVSRSRGVQVTSDEVVVVPGGKPIIFFTLLALADAGDEVIFPNPGFPIYESMIHYAGARPVPIRLREEKDFGFDVDELASLISDRTRLIILNSPQNPTGGVLSKQDIHDIAEVIGDRNIMVLSDEIYSRLLFEGEHYSIMSVPGFQERTILARRIFQNLRHDRLAPGLRSHAAGPGDAHRPAHDQFELLYRQLYPDRRSGGHARRPDVGGADAGGVSAAARRFCGRTEPDQGLLLPHAERGVLRLPQYHEDRIGVRGNFPRRCWNRPAWLACRELPLENFGEGYLRFSVANSLENLKQALAPD